jgi:hypothetical protein
MTDFIYLQQFRMINNKKEETAMETSKNAIEDALNTHLSR